MGRTCCHATEGITCSRAQFIVRRQQTLSCELGPDSLQAPTKITDGIAQPDFPVYCSKVHPSPRLAHAVARDPRPTRHSIGSNPPQSRSQLGSPKTEHRLDPDEKNGVLARYLERKAQAPRTLFGVHESRNHHLLPPRCSCTIETTNNIQDRARRVAGLDFPPAPPRDLPTRREIGSGIVMLAVQARAGLRQQSATNVGRATG